MARDKKVKKDKKAKTSSSRQQPLMMMPMSFPPQKPESSSSSESEEENANVKKNPEPEVAEDPKWAVQVTSSACALKQIPPSRQADLVEALHPDLDRAVTCTLTETGLMALIYAFTRTRANVKVSQLGALIKSSDSLMFNMYFINNY